MSDELIETTTESVLRREDAAARLRQLADQIARHTDDEQGERTPHAAATPADELAAV